MLNMNVQRRVTLTSALCLIPATSLSSPLPPARQPNAFARCPYVPARCVPADHDGRPPHPRTLPTRVGTDRRNGSRLVVNLNLDQAQGTKGSKLCRRSTRHTRITSLCSAHSTPTLPECD